MAAGISSGLRAAASSWSMLAKLAVADAMPLAQHGGDLLNGRRDLLRAAGGGQQLVDVGEAHRHRGVRRLDFRLLGVKLRGLAGVEFV